MSVVTEISVVSPPLPSEPAGVAGAVQMLASGDGRPALTLVSCMAPAPPPRR